MKTAVMLGVAISHDAGAAVVVDGRLVAAANEERFVRQKAYYGLPERSIAAVLTSAGVRPEDVTEVALANLINLPQPPGGDIAAPEGRPLMFWPAEIVDRLGLSRALLGSHAGIAMYRAILPHIAGRSRAQLRRLLTSLQIGAPIRAWDHHEAHVAGAYFDTNWDRALVISNDGFGDGYCARVSVAEHGVVRNVFALPLYHSFGAYYNYATRLCGFPKYYHAGKVTGLAARGHAERTVDLFRSRIEYHDGAYRNRGGLFRNEYRRLERSLAGVCREDIAAGVQQHLEDVLARMADEWMRRTGVRRVALSGGVHANVRANQRILELDGVEGIWIHPNMGDGGLAVGAAYLSWGAHASSHKVARMQPLEHAYLGPEYSSAECEAALRDAGLSFDRPADMAKAVAGRLAQGRVVARCVGPMEYGPRALGNRSILCPATEASINDWLNVRLKRSEFMPFAPVIRLEDAPLYLRNFDDRSAHAAEFMTITYNVTERCKCEAPAVVHIDGTARPQVLRPSVNPDYFRIIDHYERLTGLRVLINTSFNMHEEPIVCTPFDAVRAFLLGHLDTLVLGPFLVDGKPGD